jgi:DNA-binding XRE family transcriptional regulator
MKIVYIFIEIVSRAKLSDFILLCYTYRDMGTVSKQELKKLGDKIRKLRESLEFTQADVASNADLHVNYFARLERGEVNPSYETLRKIAKALQVTSKELLPF